MTYFDEFTTNFVRSEIKRENEKKIIKNAINQLYYFDYHNKNLTKAQFHIIMEVKDSLKMLLD